MNAKPAIFRNYWSFFLALKLHLLNTQGKLKPDTDDYYTVEFWEYLSANYGWPQYLNLLHRLADDGVLNEFLIIKNDGEKIQLRNVDFLEWAKSVESQNFANLSKVKALYAIDFERLKSWLMEYIKAWKEGRLIDPHNLLKTEMQLKNLIAVLIKYFDKYGSNNVVLNALALSQVDCLAAMYFLQAEGMLIINDIHMPKWEEADLALRITYKSSFVDVFANGVEDNQRSISYLLDSEKAKKVVVVKSDLLSKGGVDKALRSGNAMIAVLDYLITNNVYQLSLDELSGEAAKFVNKKTVDNFSRSICSAFSINNANKLVKFADGHLELSKDWFLLR